MANFPPLKRYIFYCIDRLIEQYHLSQPFFDVGCGVGDVSAHMAKKGWSGKAIDISAPAIEIAAKSLRKFPSVVLSKQSLFDEHETFKTIFAMDILEHLEADEAAISKIAGLLESKGYLVVAVPSNPREWRWDDDYVEHVRRYTVADLNDKLVAASLRPVVSWDFTYPVFWLMRRMYTWIKKSPPKDIADNRKKIEISGMVKMWEFPVISNLLSQESFLWRVIYHWQFRHFRNATDRGHEMIVLAQKY